MSNHWYNKAIVQVGLVNSIPQILVAAIAIYAICSTSNSVKLQLDQNSSLADKKYKRDSILVGLQLDLVKKQIALNEDQYKLNQKIAHFDSTRTAKHFSLIEENQKLKLQVDKEDLRNLCESIWDKLDLYFNDDNPQPQSPIKLGEERIRKATNKLMSSYELQNIWAKDLYGLFRLGLRNQYYLQCDSAKPYWKNSMAQLSYIESSINNFLRHDSTFIQFYNFNKTVKLIWGNFVHSNKCLFD
ncbi:MAG: hypothetical protein ISS19_00525 [Bacteroidales bacterium]|nr:hypothetical protein [Bacteroidales bacterium]